jgi:hypothetical protein
MEENRGSCSSVVDRSETAFVTKHETRFTIHAISMKKAPVYMCSFERGQGTMLL